MSNANKILGSLLLGLALILPASVGLSQPSGGGGGGGTVTLTKMNAAAALGTLRAGNFTTSGTVGNTNAANPLQFAIPTPVVVPGVTTAAIPGLTPTFRGTIEVQGSDGSYGRFVLPVGSTTSVLVYGSGTVASGAPAVGKWGISYSAGWRYSNQMGASTTFTLIEVLTGAI